MLVMLIGLYPAISVTVAELPSWNVHVAAPPDPARTARQTENGVPGVIALAPVAEFTAVLIGCVMTYSLSFFAAAASMAAVILATFQRLSTLTPCSSAKAISSAFSSGSGLGSSAGL